MDLKAQFQPFFKGEVLDDSPTLDTYSKDASIFQLTPQVVVCPQDTEDITQLVQFVAKNKGLSITPRSAGTCMSGGPLSESIVMDMTKHFNQVLDVQTDHAVTQPGVYYRDFEKKTLEKNVLLPCYTASREINTVGGMVGNNSAGEKTLSYGQTERYVRRLKVVLRDGKEYTVQPLNKDQLKQKMAQKDLEGDLYRQVYDLVDQNYELIKKSEPKTSKNSTGYLLWKVWDKETFDMTKLLVGSQGTLGVITEIEFALVENKPFQSTLIIELPNLDKLDEVINEVLRFKPESFECFDDQTLTYSLRFLTELIKEFKLSHGFMIYLKFFTEMLQLKFGALPKLILLAGFTSADEKQAYEQCKNAQLGLAKFNLKTKITDPVSAEKYWVMRRNSFNLLRHHSQNMRTAPFIDDIIVRPEFLPQFLPKLNALMEPYRKYLVYTVAGHIGDGNFHIIPLMNFQDPITDQIIPEISQKVFDLVFEFQGSMAAEHNDGLVRGPYLPLMYGEEVYQLFKQVKNIFDPNNIFNPHKKTDATFEYSLKHIVDNHQMLHPTGS